MAIPRGQRALRACRSVLLLCCLRSPAPLWGAPPCTAELGPGGDVQAALDALRPGPVALCLGAGEFPVHRFVSIDRDDVVLRGQGATTVIRADRALESPVIVVGDHRRQVPEHVVAKVRIESLRVVGGGWHGREYHPDRPYLMNSAIAVRAGRHVVIRDVELSDCRSACVLAEHGSRDVRLEGNVATGAYWDGISLNDTSKSRVVDNTVRGNQAAGISVEHLVDSVIAGNTLADNGSAGIYLSNASRNVVVENRIANNQQAGVFLTCAVVQRHVPARCFRDTMSHANFFVRNEFLGNKLGYVVAPNATASCAGRGFRRNVSREDRLAPDRNIEPDWDRYGHCLEYVDPKPEDVP